MAGAKGQVHPSHSQSSAKELHLRSTLYPINLSTAAVLLDQRRCWGRLHVCFLATHLRRPPLCPPSRSHSSEQAETRAEVEEVGAKARGAVNRENRLQVLTVFCMCTI